MRQMKISTKIFISLGLVSTLILIVTSLGIGVLLNIGIEKRVEQNLRFEADQLIDKHILIERSQIFFQRGENGETISSHLRDVDVSAVILDKDLQILGSYGIFHNMEVNNQTNEMIGYVSKETTEKNHDHYRDVTFANGLMYDTFSIPLKMDGEVVGYILLAKEGTIVSLLWKTVILILTLLLPISLAINLGLGYYLTKKTFDQLNLLTNYLNSVEIGYFPPKITINDSMAEEVRSLSSSFNKMLNRIKEGNTAQRNFISNVSHEINTPLTQAVSSLELIEVSKAMKDHPELKKTLNQTKKRLVSIGETISSILHLSTLDKNKNELKDKINVQKGVTELLMNFEDKVKIKNIRVVNNVLPTNIYLPSKYFNILINNLISNAIKHNHKNGILEIGSKVIGNKAKLVFRNSYSTNAINEQDEPSHGLGVGIINGICKVCRLQIVMKREKGFQVVELRGLNVK